MHEFLTRPDEFRTFGVGEAVIWTSLGPSPERVHVTQARLPDTDRDPVDAAALYRSCGPTALPAGGGDAEDHEGADIPVGAVRTTWPVFQASDSGDGRPTLDSSAVERPHTASDSAAERQLTLQTAAVPDALDL